MLYHLLYPLHEHVFAFNVFRYITFRAAYAAVTALLVSFLLGPWMIRMLRDRGAHRGEREDVPATHGTKSATPTMGGLLILLAVVGPTLLWANLTNRYVWILLVVTVWLAALGFADDYRKVVLRKRKGLIGRYKLLGQMTLGLGVGVVLTVFAADPDVATRTSLPFFKSAEGTDLLIDFGVLYIPLVILVITGSSNAVNLADGLDGLAAGLVLFVAASYAALAYLTGHAQFSDYLDIQYIEGAGEMAVFLSALVGACMGFLWWNAPPAELFMGDTGSLMLGGVLGATALLIKKELLLLVVGGIFVAEVLSVVIQVLAFKRTGRRVFKMAPLHHHFELSGWAETKVVVRFWIVAALLSLVSLSTLKLR